MRVATISAAISGNKGAASMIEALERRAQIEGWTIVVLTTYPDEDRRLAPAGVEIAPLTPVPLVLRDLPLALLSRLLPKRFGRRMVRLSPGLRALVSADVVADISGVSFSDDRGTKFHVYNSILAMLPILLRVPIVKCSQAIGPFEQRLNRVLARLILPRVDHILARGQRSHDAVAELLGDASHVEQAADLAFTLGHDQAVQPEIQRTLRDLAGDGVIAVMPSAVVEAWCDRRGIDHTELFADVVARACDELGVGVVLVPHAYRACGKPRRMDDARVCRAIAGRLGARPDVAIVDADLEPAQIRAIVASVDLLVASRFHGMITGLGSSTPTVVVGWGHKYAEVLAQFDAERLAMDYSTLATPEIVSRSIAEVWNDRDAIGATIAARLADVRRSAERNFEALTGAARGAP